MVLQMRRGGHLQFILAVELHLLLPKLPKLDLVDQPPPQLSLLPAHQNPHNLQQGFNHQVSL